MLHDLMLLSGIDIPFPQAQIVIHQPTIKEIAYVGEESFFSGCELLNFSKNMLSTEDKSRLEDKTDFEVLMSVLGDNSDKARIYQINVMFVLTLIFPEYTISLQKDKIVLGKEGEEDHTLTSENFDDFKEIIEKMFCLRHAQSDDYKPGNDAAQKLADRFKKAREKVAETKGEKHKIDILSRYTSILTIGLQQDLHSMLNCTVYQLFDLFERFELKQGYDIYIRAKMAGAQDLEEVESWLKDIHEQ